jgi:hypothetical protein
VIWAGTDDGLIHITRDAGKTWTNVTPSALTPWAKVSLIEASHFDPNTAYAAINTLRLDDVQPHIYRTRDGGLTWREIVGGLPAGAIVNTVREDTLRRGLLFAGTERAVFTSFDDGETWQPLRLNMPATSIRDLVIKDDDVVVGTHGRGFWILDDIMPLRQITADIARAPAYLFRPGIAYRARWNKNTDTPMPPDEPAAPNPPDGITFSYLLGSDVQGPITLEVIETLTGELIRRYSSDDPEEKPIEGRNIPDYWIRPPQRLLATPGLHRFTWDVRYGPPPVDEPSYPMAAVARNTPQSPQGMWILPGSYQVRLTAGGRPYRQSVTVRMDPRVKTQVADLTQQHKVSKQIDGALRQIATAVADVRRRLTTAPAEAARLQSVLRALQQAGSSLAEIFDSIQAADAKPTAAQDAAATAALAKAEAALALPR